MARKEKNNSFSQGANFGIDPDALDFSQDLWSWRGETPKYAIQSDGFSYDVIDEDENDRNAISLGILGMIIIVYNAKSAKIKEDDVQPVFKEVIATRNWNTIPLKVANNMAKTVVNKLVDTSTSGDVFDLASYAPLEVKRALLKKLFGIARKRLAPEYQEEAEQRILEDIVPAIFANPDFELALLTGMIVSPKSKPKVEFADDQETEAPVSDSVVESYEESDETKPEEIIIPDRDAEKTLQEQLKTLKTAVPPKPAKKPEPVDDYVPFSDMERQSNHEVQAGDQLTDRAPIVPEPFGDEFGAAKSQNVKQQEPASQPEVQQPQQNPAEPVVPPTSAVPARQENRPIVPPPPDLGNVVRPPMPYVPQQPPVYPQQPVAGYPVYPPYPQSTNPVDSPQPPAADEPPAIERTQPRRP